MKFIILVVIFGNILTAFTLNCGYESCPKVNPNLLNVHIVTHTHDDVGWLKTVDQYYYGSKTLIQKAGVQYIIDSVVQELLKDPEKRFIYVESAFFFKWWREQTAEMQDKVRMLVNEGRLEFIGGAWSMNDEATTHYQSIIDQFAWGLRRLNDTFGDCGRPRIGWQIDPFGHSREMASIFAQMGYDGLFFGRLDYQDKEERMTSKTAEMIWRASANLGEKSHLFTGALYNQYQPPPGFCFDVLCADEPIIDDPNSPDNNVERRVSQFLDFINEQRKYYRTNNIILTMGGDFTYMDANVYYKNLDKLIRYANDRQQNGSDANLFYSTPSCYLKSLYDSQIKWPTKNDDFFPYSSDSHSYWTGYYTSRPTLKRFERVGNNFLQICKQLTAISPKRDINSLAHLTAMREVMGVMQHHDAVTGTEKQKVALDYEKQLAEGIRGCEVNAKVALNHLQGSKMDLESCHLLNISICHISERNEHFIVTVYNPLGQFTDEYIRLPVKKGVYLVDDSDEILESEIVPIPESVLLLHFRKPLIRFELVFLARNIPPMGYKSFYVNKSKEESKRLVPMEEPKLKSPDLTTIGNELIQITFDANGFLASVTANGISRLISQEFLYYDAASGNNQNPESRSSGAYIFRPRNNTYHPVTQWPNIKVYKNDLVEEVHQRFNSWMSQVVRVYKGEKFAEFEWLIGPIPAGDHSGKEIITRFNTNIKSDGVFYTDSNGREMIKRKRDYRSTWKVKLEESVAGNYYPITSKIAIEDDEARLAILVDRAQGGTSLFDGSLEIMIHRRLLHDDAFGVDEPLNEVEYHKGLIARGIHYLILGPSQRESSPTTHATERFVQQKKHLAPWKFISADKEYLSNYHHNSVFSGLKNSLPRNVHLLTFEPWHENEILIRFEHIFEQNEDPEFSKSVQINLTEIMSQFLVVERIRETTLDGSKWLEDLHRLKFESEEPEDSYSSYATDARKMEKESIEIEQLSEEPKADNMKWHKIPIGHKGDKKSIIDLEPMQIRTFVLTLQK